MESKIEKIEGAYDIPILKDKLNRVIDYLNSQDQEGYEKRTRIRGELSGETEHIKAHKEYLATSKQDTPEGWEKEFELPDEIEHEDCIEVLADKHKLWEICPWEEPELDPDKVVAFIKQLLEERECRAREEGRKEVVETILELNEFNKKYIKKKKSYLNY